MTTLISGSHLESSGRQAVMAVVTCTARDCVGILSHILDFIAFPSGSHAAILSWDFLSAADAVINSATSPFCDLTLFAKNAERQPRYPAFIYRTLVRRLS